MKLPSLIYKPFPRPKPTSQNFLWVTLVGLAASVFILLYEPFGIENTSGDWYVDLIIFSLGILFIISILFIEFLIPKWFPKAFEQWTFGKAFIWYPFVIVFVGGIQFLYKSWWGGWHDFTVIEFVMVLARTLGISITVVFFVLGIWQYFSKEKLAAISSNIDYMISTPDGKKIKFNLNHLLYVASDDNYVDLHMVIDGERKKITLRSSLKHIESQLINPISPILRCHRKYLINTSHFRTKEASSKKMVISLKGYEDLIPVSAQFVPAIRKSLSIRP